MENLTGKTWYYGGKRIRPAVFDKDGNKVKDGDEFPKGLKLPPEAKKQDKPAKADKSNDKSNAEAER